MPKTKNWLQEHIGKNIQIIKSDESDIITVLDEEHVEILFNQQDTYVYEEIGPINVTIVEDASEIIQEESFADQWLDNQANKY